MTLSIHAAAQLSCSSVPIVYTEQQCLFVPSTCAQFNSLSDRIAQEHSTEMASSSSTSANVNVKAPQLASASGAGGGMPHALWRPQMQTFLMQHGIEERDYASEISRWREIDAAVQQAAKAAEDEGIALMLGEAASVKSEPENKSKEAAAEKAVKQRVTDLIGRSRKAFGFLYSALPADLRPLVADVPQGYAYGIWSFLEKKFRSTEQDSVMALWRRIIAVVHEEGETFDVFKARVDSLVELLTNAKQTLAPGLYASILLWNLQPSYSTAVLTLKTSDRLRDPVTIDWSYVAEYMAQYERSQLGLGETEGISANDRAMAARGSTPGSAPSSSANRHADVECYNCHRKGHFASKCREPDRRQYAANGHQHRMSRSGNHGEEGASSPAQSAPRVNAARNNYFDPLIEVVNERHNANQLESCNGREVGRSYLARAMTGLTGTQKKSDDESTSNLKRLRRPGEFKPLTATPAAAPAPAASSKSSKPATFGPKTEAKSRESERRSPASAPSAAPKALDAALRTTAKAVDSGATVSITGNKNNLINLRRCMPMPILMADNTIVSAVYKGDMPMRLAIASKPDTRISITIRDVYYHERFDANLLSWGCMRLDGWEMHSDKDGTFFVTPKGSRINASTRGKLTILDDAGPERAYASRLGRFVCQTADDLLLLHQRVGHASWSALTKMCQATATHGIADISGMSAAEKAEAERRIKECTACSIGKQHRNPLGHRGLDKGSEPGEVIHMDVFYVAMRDPSTGAKYNEYCLLGTDGYTEYRQWAKTTSQHALQAEVIGMIKRSTVATGRRPRLVVSDLGSEFENRTVKGYCRHNGIQHQPTPARAKELNGIAEKSVDSVKNHVRAMLHAAGMPEQQGWSRAVAHHIYLWNRTHIGAHTGKTPYEATFDREPSIVNVGVFGCDAFVHQDRTQRDTTFSPKAQPGIYLGHDPDQNCAVVHMLHSGKVIRVKDVLFREGSFKNLAADRSGDSQSIRDADLDDFDAATGRDDNQTHTLEDADDESDESIPAPQFEVSAITSDRTTSGRKEYHVKWTGYDALTWEPADVIMEDAPEAVKEYESIVSRRSEVRSAPSRITRSMSSAAASSSSSSSPAVRSRDSNSDSDDDDPSHVLAARNVAAQCL
jgi:hypothetical protein